MKKILLILLLNVSFLFSEDSFIDICKNPTPEQKKTINALIDGYNEYRKMNINKPLLKYDEPNICEVLSKGKGFPPINGKGISDISIIRYFSENQSLNLWNNKITDITPLKYLTKLTKLNLGLNKVSKGVESLEELPLIYLRISLENDSVGLAPIGKIKTLENLYIFNGKNSEALKSLSNVKSLSLSSVDIKSLCDLKGLQLLEQLNLFDNNLKSLKCIDKFPNLKEFTIKGNPITDLTPLINAESIKKFDFHDIPVEDISPLAKMKNLRSILFTKTKIKYLSPLKESKSIQFAEDFSEKFIEEYFNRSLAWCSPKSMKEVRTGKTCLNEDGSLKPWWKRILGL